MNLYEFAGQIEVAVNGLFKTAQKAVRSNHDAEWRLVGLTGRSCTWAAPSGEPAPRRR